jgi:hypothetical protein|nr:MAG TPA: hypothetical protein [Herelleviridae sp.]
MIMKINFKRFEVQTSFEGNKQIFNITHDLGNMMMYNGSVLLDIGFEDLAKTIYYSDGEVEVPECYCKAIIEVVKQSSFIAAVKREVINILSNNQA